MLKKETDFASYKRMTKDIAVVMFKYVNPDSENIKNHVPISGEDFIDDGEFIFIEKKDLVILFNNAAELLVKLRQMMRGFYYLFGREYCSKHCDNFDSLNKEQKVDVMTESLIKFFSKRDIVSADDDLEELKEDFHQILLEAINGKQAK